MGTTAINGGQWPRTARIPPRSIRKRSVGKIIGHLERMRDDEQAYMRQIPYTLQSSDKYYEAALCAAALDDAICSLYEAF
jgi:hypothetical protein